MGRKSSLTTGQKASIRHYAEQGEGPSGISYYTGISPSKVSYYLKSLEREQAGKGNGNRQYRNRNGPAPVAETATEAGKHGRGPGRTSNSTVFMIEQMAAHGYNTEQILNTLGVSAHVAEKYSDFDVRAYLEAKTPTEADVEKKVDRRILRQETIEKIKALAREGRTIAGIVEETGVSNRSISKYAGAELNERLGGEKRQGTRLTAEERETIIAAIGTGKYSGPSEVGSEFDISYHTANALWKSTGRKVRAIGEKPETTRERGIRLTKEEAATMDMAILSGIYTHPADVAREFHVSYQTARIHWETARVAVTKPTVLIEPPKPTPPKDLKIGISAANAERLDTLWGQGIRTVNGLHERTGFSRHMVGRYMEGRGLISERSRREEQITKDNRPAMPPVILEDLSAAIILHAGEKKMEKEAAEQTAQHVLNFFGYSNRIIDNILEPEDRDIFYMLEDAGIATTEREETTLYDGREWRIHYWVFNHDRIKQILAPLKTAKREKSPEDVYEELDDGLWHGHGAEPVEGVHVTNGLVAAQAGARGSG
ncbi:MAG: hypothetical protein HY362_03785 [Candidatus Aenigmarchaeota archaeon]|nr:hypothetical protein [Candidatus Aenigmarchaeota archaeon]